MRLRCASPAKSQFEPLFDHQVDELAGNADGLDHRFTVDPLSDRGLSGGLHGGVVGSGGTMTRARILPRT